MSELFFISDTHFYHHKIVEFESQHRPFKDVNEMNEKLISNWNSVVGVRDTVYHLGDVLFGRPEQLQILSRLNGNKKLVMGNHDVHGVREYLKYFRDVFAVHKWNQCVLSHIPIHPSQQYRFRANIHGHLHSKDVMKIVGVGTDPFYVNVSCEKIGLTPISADVLLKSIKNDG